MTRASDEASPRSCCAPQQPRSVAEPVKPMATTLEGDPLDFGLMPIPGGTFVMGTDEPQRWPCDGESPARPVQVDDFLLASGTTTNRMFTAFVAQTGYVTQAERFGSSFVFGGHLPADFPATRGVVAAPWWREVEGADWMHPFGPQSTLHRGLADHPVVHVSRNDAATFCAWAGVRLPNEAEWERAARGGVDGQRFPWGDSLLVDGWHRCNTFQGIFPSQDTGDDGFVGTAPAHAYEPNAFGLHNMVGNVWEWCDGAFTPGDRSGVARGGSYLCHESYCDRYRVSARTALAPDSTAGNVGFRVAAPSR